MLVWMNRSACSRIAATTAGSQWPRFVTPIPAAKSRKRLPSTSVITDPFAAAATIGVVWKGPLETYRSRSAKIARLWGPGTAVLSWIDPIATEPGGPPQHSRTPREIRRSRFAPAADTLEDHARSAR